MSTNIVIFYEIKSHLKRIFKNYFRRCKLIIIFVTIPFPYTFKERF